MKIFSLVALIGLFTFFFLKGETLKKILPRGLRNNNPLNLREGENGGIAWNGEHSKDLDKSFEEFTHSKYGIRAGTKVLLNYQKLHGLYTVKDMINRFAPPSENNTNAYINHVAKALNVAPNENIVLSKDNILPMIKAMIKHENGINPYTDSEILEGIALA